MNSFLFIEKNCFRLHLQMTRKKMPASLPKDVYFVLFTVIMKASNSTVNVLKETAFVFNDICI